MRHDALADLLPFASFGFRLCSLRWTEKEREAKALKRKQIKETIDITPQKKQIQINLREFLRKGSDISGRKEKLSYSKNHLNRI